MLGRQCDRSYHFKQFICIIIILCVCGIEPNLVLQKLSSKSSAVYVSNLTFKLNFTHLMSFYYDKIFVYMYI